MSEQRRNPTPAEERPEPTTATVTQPDARQPAGRGDAGSPSPVDAKAAKPVDVVYVHAACESGAGYHVLRQRGEQLEVGQIRAMREGQPIHGQVVRLSPRKESERLFDVDVVVDAPKRASRSGPPQVATAEYRRNWEQIFGKGATRRAGGEAPN